MITTVATRAVISHWGICPVCLKERRTRKSTGVMVVHRKWIKSIPYGHMAPCEGGGLMPLPPVPAITK